MVPPPPTAVLPLTERGDLPFVALHGEPLYLHALRALAEVLPDPLVAVADDGIARRVDQEVRRAGVGARVRTRWYAEVDRAAGLLVHDPLCPLTPAAFLGEVAGLAAGGRSVAAYRPVTDTVKTAVDGRIEGTVDREQLAAVLSPVVLAAGVLGEVAPPTGDLAELVPWTRERGPLELVMAPAMARRVDDVSSVNLLECLDELGHQVRH